MGHKAKQLVYSSNSTSHGRPATFVTAHAMTAPAERAAHLEDRVIPACTSAQRQRRTGGTAVPHKAKQRMSEIMLAWDI